MVQRGNIRQIHKNMPSLSLTRIRVTDHYEQIKNTPEKVVQNSISVPIELFLLVT